MSNSAEYWRRRFSALEEAAHKKAERAVRELEELYREAQISVNKEIESWYGRFATNNGISLMEARKWLVGNQLEEFHWTVEQYIKVGEQAGLSEEWLKKLENASAKFHISRLEAVQTGIQQQIELLYGNQTETIDRLLRDVAGSAYNHTAYEIQKGIGVGWDITALDQAKLDTLLSKPWTTDGRTFSDRLWLQQKNLVNTIQKELTQGLLRGDSTQKITEAVRKSLKVSRNQAARLVYTETAYFQALADKKSYEALGVKNVEIIETLDGITCATCQGFDGKIVPLSQFEPAVTVPPYHPHCRGTTAPAIDNEEGKRIARNAEGKTYYVPADMSYEEWIAKQKGLYGKETVEKLQKMAYNENADREQYLRYKEWLGSNAPKTFKEFQTLKYSDSWDMFKAYTRSIRSGELTPLTDFALYQSKSTEIDRVLVGQTTENGLKITGKSQHYIARTIGSVSQRRNGVEPQDALDTLLHPIKVDTIKTNTNGRSQRFKGKNCYVTVNPDTGILIQANPHKGG